MTPTKVGNHSVMARSVHIAGLAGRMMAIGRSVQSFAQRLPSVEQNNTLYGRYSAFCQIIYTIILVNYVCVSQLATAGRNSCSIVSVDVSNCSYRLTVDTLTSSRLSSVKQFFICEK